MVVERLGELISRLPERGQQSFDPGAVAGL